MTTTLAWDVTLCSLVDIDQRFRGNCDYETIYQAARHHISKYHILNATASSELIESPFSNCCNCKLKSAT
jgi:hypothetical protein